MNRHKKKCIFAKYSMEYVFMKQIPKVLILKKMINKV